VFGQLLHQAELPWTIKSCLQRRVSRHRRSSKQRRWTADGRAISRVGTETCRLCKFIVWMCSNQRKGYTYSVFNLVYETNVASCRIWDALGFKRIGRVKGCGNLKSHPDQLIDAIIYGRDLGPDGEDFITEERFQRIKFYLKNGRYPDGADRSEKSRLRSAASHYRLLPATENEPEKLMLKGKEVISDPQLQYETTRKIHVETHGGINKTTAAVAERYHWIRIKETASQVIKNCPLCLAASTPSARNATQPERRGPGGTWTLGHFYPFDREYSVPPGDAWLSSYGQLKDQSPQTPAAPPPEMVELPAMEVGADVNVNDEAEHEAEAFAMEGIDMADGIFGNENIPVDPALMDGMDGLDQARYFLDSQAEAQLQTEAAQAARDANGSDSPTMKAPKRPARGKRGAGELSEAEAEAPSVGRSVRSKRGVITVSEALSEGQKMTPQKHSKERQQKRVPSPAIETSSEAVSVQGKGTGSKPGRGRPRKSAKGGKEAS
jgi:H2C2 zinc finger